MSSASGHKPALPALTLAALGIVYGDIGTSPLYTLKECFSAHTHLTPTVANVTGILSLIFWSIIVVVTLKYISFVLRADNKGEGGILTLAALAHNLALALTAAGEHVAAQHWQQRAGEHP